MQSTNESTGLQDIPKASAVEDRTEPRLLKALRCKAAVLNHSQVEVAHRLGVTSGYLIQLRNGSRDIRRISLDFARACATYLETSTVNVLLLAGAIDVTDFSGPVETKRRMEQGLRALLNDPTYGAFIDEPMVRSLPPEAQELLVSLYEEASQSEFGADQTIPPLLWSSLRLATVLAEQDVAIAEDRTGYRGEGDDNAC